MKQDTQPAPLTPEQKREQDHAMRNRVALLWGIGTDPADAEPAPDSGTDSQPEE